MVGIASLVYVASANTIQEKVKQQHQQETDVRSVCLQVNGYDARESIGKVNKFLHAKRVIFV
jgi:hypothetical protein